VDRAQTGKLVERAYKKDVPGEEKKHRKNRVREKSSLVGKPRERS